MSRKKITKKMLEYNLLRVLLQVIKVQWQLHYEKKHIIRTNIKK